MRIETDKYLITSNSHNVIVQLKEVVIDSPMLKDKSKIGSVQLSKERFYPNLEKAYKGLANALILNSDAQHFDDIKNLMRELIDEVKAMPC